MSMKIKWFIESNHWIADRLIELLQINEGIIAIIAEIPQK